MSHVFLLTNILPAAFGIFVIFIMLDISKIDYQLHVHDANPKQRVVVMVTGYKQVSMIRGPLQGLLGLLLELEL